MFWTVEDDRELWTRYAKAEGVAEGIAEGEAKGEAKLSRLIKALFKDGRIDDVERAADDETCREALFKELGIA